jgi:hypothetical protein
MLPWLVFVACSEAAEGRQPDFEGLIGGTRGPCVSAEVFVAEAHGAKVEKGRNGAMELTLRSTANLTGHRQAAPCGESSGRRPGMPSWGARSLHVRLKTIVSCCKQSAGTCSDRYTFVAASLRTSHRSLLANHRSRGGTVNRPCTRVSRRKQTTAHMQGRNVPCHPFASISELPSPSARILDRAARSRYSDGSEALESLHARLS